MAPITAWRICAPRYAETAFSGEGARIYGGRWNSKGRASSTPPKASRSRCWSNWCTWRTRRYYTPSWSSRRPWRTVRSRFCTPPYRTIGEPTPPHHRSRRSETPGSPRGPVAGLEGSERHGEGPAQLPDQPVASGLRGHRGVRAGAPRSGPPDHRPLESPLW